MKSKTKLHQQKKIPEFSASHQYNVTPYIKVTAITDPATAVPAMNTLLTHPSAKEPLGTSAGGPPGAGEGPAPEGAGESADGASDEGDGAGTEVGDGVGAAGAGAGERTGAGAGAGAGVGVGGATTGAGLAVGETVGVATGA